MAFALSWDERNAHWNAAAAHRLEGAEQLALETRCFDLRKLVTRFKRGTVTEAEAKSMTLAHAEALLAEAEKALADFKANA